MLRTSYKLLYRLIVLMGLFVSLGFTSFSLYAIGLPSRFISRVSSDIGNAQSTFYNNLSKGLSNHGQGGDVIGGHLVNGSPDRVVTSSNVSQEGASLPNHDDLSYRNHDAFFQNIQARRNLVEKIWLIGGEVIHIGHTIKVIIPSDQLFRGQTWYLYHHNMPILNYVASLIKSYSTINVGINAYYGYYMTKDQQKRLKKLTTKQAPVSYTHLTLPTILLV